MKPSFYLLLFSIPIFLLEGIVRYLPFSFLHVDLILLVVIYMGFFIPIFPGAFFVFFLGIFQESLASSFHGTLLFSYLLVYFFLRLFYRQLFLQRKSAQWIWVFLLSLAQRSLVTGLLLWQGYRGGGSLWILIFFSVFEGLFSLVFFPFLKKNSTFSTNYVA